MSFNVYKSNTYNEFRERRGKPFSQFMKKNPSKKEIKEWQWHEDDFQEVKLQLVFLAANLRRAANRANLTQSIDIELDYVYNVGASQDFICALTGDELEFTRGGTEWLGKWCNPYSCTIDRIDSSKGYIKGNIQLVTWRANCMKQHMKNDEFIAFCKDVASFNR